MPRKSKVSNQCIQQENLEVTKLAKREGGLMIFEWPSGTWETLSFPVPLAITVVLKLFPNSATETNPNSSSSSPTFLVLHRLSGLLWLVRRAELGHRVYIQWTHQFVFSFQSGALPLHYHRARASCFVQNNGSRGQGTKNIPAQPSPPHTTSAVSAHHVPGRHLHLGLHCCKVRPWEMSLGRRSHTSLGTANPVILPFPVTK